MYYFNFYILVFTGDEGISASKIRRSINLTLIGVFVMTEGTDMKTLLGFHMLLALMLASQVKTRL